MNLKHFTPHPGETILARVHPKRSTLLFPFLELLVITGMVWLAIGLIDHQLINQSVAILGYETPNPVAFATAYPTPETTAYLWGRRALLILWLLLGWRRFIKPVMNRNKQLTILTNYRLITHDGQRRNPPTEIPLQHITDARAKGSKLRIYLQGAYRPWELANLPQPKKLATIIHYQSRKHLY